MKLRRVFDITTALNLLVFHFSWSFCTFEWFLIYLCLVNLRSIQKIHCVVFNEMKLICLYIFCCCMYCEWMQRMENQLYIETYKNFVNVKCKCCEALNGYVNTISWPYAGYCFCINSLQIAFWCLKWLRHKSLGAGVRAARLYMLISYMRILGRTMKENVRYKLYKCAIRFD